MEAHIAALLPTQNRVVSADENTAFLAHYDLNEHDVLRNIKAIGEATALSFNGTSSSYVEIPSSPTYTLSALTIATWIKVPSSIVASYRGIVAKQDDATNQRDFNLYIYSTNTTSITNLHFSSTIWTGGLPALPTPFQPNTWHHIAITISKTGYITYYTDGVAFGGTQGTAGTASRNVPIKIGKADNFWNGLVSSTKIWNRDLSSAEITADINGTVNESGLIGYWKLNEGQGSIARDYSAFHNDGVIYGGTWTTGNSVFTLRPKEGYFGGSAIAVEEGTTNLVTNPNDTTSGWTGGTYTVTNDNLLNFTGEYNAGKITSTSTSAWLAKVGGIVGIATSTQYVTSWYLKAGTLTSCTVNWGGAHTGTKVTFSVNLSTGEIAGLTPVAGENYGVEKVANGFWRIWYTTTTSGTTFYPQLNIGANGYVIYGGMQVEKRVFPTSFINGTRDTGKLIYPHPLYGLDIGTISFWAKSPNMQSILKNQVWMWDYNGVTASPWIGIDNSTGGYTIVPFGVPAQNYYGAWHMYTIVKRNSTTYDCYIDGSLISTKTNGANLFKSSTKISIGAQEDGSYPANLLIDELRMDNIARTDAEIAAWYYSNSPFWPRGIYRKPY